MLNMLKKEKGFTLIELMIVVAIIGILAAIAIPQFATYRVKAFDAAASADAKNGVTTFEAFYADFYKYPDTNAVVGEGPKRFTLAHSSGTATTTYWNYSKGVICGSKGAAGYGIGCKHTGGGKIFQATDATPSVFELADTEGDTMVDGDIPAAGDILN